MLLNYNRFFIQFWRCRITQWRNVWLKRSLLCLLFLLDQVLWILCVVRSHLRTWMKLNDWHSMASNTVITLNSLFCQGFFLLGIYTPQTQFHKISLICRTTPCCKMWVIQSSIVYHRINTASCSSHWTWLILSRPFLFLRCTCRNILAWTWWESNRQHNTVSHSFSWWNTLFFPLIVHVLKRQHQVLHTLGNWLWHRRIHYCISLHSFPFL